MIAESALHITNINLAHIYVSIWCGDSPEGTYTGEMLEGKDRHQASEHIKAPTGRFPKGIGSVDCDMAEGCT